MKELYLKQKAFFEEGHTRGAAWRYGALSLLKSAVKTHEGRILEALRKDLGKTAEEAYMSEIGLVLKELSYAAAHVFGWARPRLSLPSLPQFPGICRVYPQPKGCALIISPWNYPFYLAMAPVCAAISAGCCFVLKPSSKAPETAAVINDIISECFEESFAAVVIGGHEAGDELLKLPFDHIFFTGSAAVGKRVMRAAAENLSPVTLELGGKSPCIVDKTADIKLAARRIAWGKLINAGQTCIAPDYVLAHESVAKALIEELKNCIVKMYGENPAGGDTLVRMPSKEKYDRTVTLGEGCEKIGEDEPAALRIAPRIAFNPEPGSALLKEEIFAPILPVIPYSKLIDVVEFIAARPRPLALYLFSGDSRVKKHIVRNLSFGGGCINGTLLHVAGSAPFGGTGESGIGKYHGKHGFDEFTHYKTVLHKGRAELSLAFPPYDKNTLKTVKRFFK